MVSYLFESGFLIVVGMEAGDWCGGRRSGVTARKYKRSEGSGFVYSLMLRLRYRRSMVLTTRCMRRRVKTKSGLQRTKKTHQSEIERKKVILTLSDSSPDVKVNSLGLGKMRR